jgi:hypothetical protein
MAAVMPGDVFIIKKNPTSVFVEPLIDGHLIHASVVQDWKTWPWSAKFQVCCCDGMMNLWFISYRMGYGMNEAPASGQVMVGDERAIDIVDQFKTRFNNLEIKMGRMVAKGDKRAI